LLAPKYKTLHLDVLEGICHVETYRSHIYTFAGRRSRSICLPWCALWQNANWTRRHGHEWLPTTMFSGKRTGQTWISCLLMCQLLTGGSTKYVHYLYY